MITLIHIGEIPIIEHMNLHNMAKLTKLAVLTRPNQLEVAKTVLDEFWVLQNSVVELLLRYISVFESRRQIQLVESVCLWAIVLATIVDVITPANLVLLRSIHQLGIFLQAFDYIF